MEYMVSWSNRAPRSAFALFALRSLLRTRIYFVDSFARVCFGRKQNEPLPPMVSLLHEQLPFRDAVGVADECRHWQFLRRAGHGEQLQAGFVRQAVALLRVHGLV